MVSLILWGVGWPAMIGECCDLAHSFGFLVGPNKCHKWQGWMFGEFPQIHPNTCDFWSHPGGEEPASYPTHRPVIHPWRQRHSPWRRSFQNCRGGQPTEGWWRVSRRKNKRLGGENKMMRSGKENPKKDGTGVISQRFGDRQFNMATARNDATFHKVNVHDRIFSVLLVNWMFVQDFVCLTTS